MSHSEVPDDWSDLVLYVKSFGSRPVSIPP